jgi:hypothetical protein
MISQTNAPVTEIEADPPIRTAELGQTEIEEIRRCWESTLFE